MKCFEEKMSYPQFLKYLVPSVLTMIFLSFYTTIDGFFVSRYAGSDALAGINIVIPITCIIFGTAVMFATGSAAIIGEKMGQKREQEANEIFTFIAIVLLILSLVFTIGGILFLKPICIFLGSSERLMEHVIPYAFVIFLGAVPMSFKLFFEYLVRTDGRSQIGMVMSLAGLTLNVVFDYIFVVVFRMGTFGAAWGTFLSITVSMIIGLLYFLKYSQIRFCKPNVNWKVLLKSCTNGSSEMLTELSTGITTFLFNIIIMKYFGEDGVAAVTIIMYIYYFFISFYMGIAVATAPVVSYNYGAQNYGKIKETNALQFYYDCHQLRVDPGSILHLWKRYHSLICRGWKCVLTDLGWVEAVQYGFCVYRSECISFRIFYCTGKWIYFGSDLIAAFVVPCRYIYTGSSKTDRCVWCLADNADVGSCDNFHCNLPVSDIRKAFHEGKIGIR